MGVSPSQPEVDAKCGERGGRPIPEDWQGIGRCHVEGDRERRSSRPQGDEQGYRRNPQQFSRRPRSQEEPGCVSQV
ncbi:hypothetical protein LV35_04192 [Acinetobacter baumannii]|uniref:Uncharacterized protein n=1 Tax=Acinetobacter baumannii TaxID=470 RepID=A0AAJ0QSZ7_ACIBA|nr:hypothetical protein LV35_04192 [Acinetobacter baumannii]